MDKEQYQELRQLVKSLPKPNYTLSVLACFLNSIIFLSAVVLTLSNNVFLACLGIALWAVQMNHAYLIVHECSHGSFFRTTKINEYCGNIAAFFALMPFYSRRSEHRGHHRSAGSIHEPTAARAIDRFGNAPTFVLTLMSICWKCWIPIFAINENIMLWKLAYEKSASRESKVCSILSITAYLVIVISLLIALPLTMLLVLLLKVIAVAYLYMFLVEYFNLPHHIEAPIENIPAHVPFYEQVKFSKSCSPLPKPVGSWLLLNFNYHVAHHLFPAVHWSQVKELHEIVVRFVPALGETHSELQSNIAVRKRPAKEILDKFVSVRAASQSA